MLQGGCCFLKQLHAVRPCFPCPRLSCLLGATSCAGFIPNFSRLGSWNVAMFLTLEQVCGREAGCTA